MKIKIGLKLVAGFLLVISLMVVLTLYFVSVSQKSLQESVNKSSILLAEEMLKRIDKDIYLMIEEVQSKSKGLLLQKTLLESNKEFKKLDSIEEYVNGRDRKWISLPKYEISPFIQELISNELSTSLRNEFIEFYNRKYGYEFFSEVFVTNKYGANVAQTIKTSDYKQNDEEWWQIAKEKGFYLGDIEHDESSEMYQITIGVRIDNEKGNFIGAMKAGLSVKGIIREAELTTKRYETTEIKLITKHGRLIYATKVFRFLEDMSENEFFKKIKDESRIIIVEEGRIKKLFSYAHSKGYRGFKGFGWILVVGHDVEEVLKPTVALRNSMVAVALFLITMGIIIALLMSRSITKPIAKLSKAAEIIGKGNLSHRVELKTKDEIGELAMAFNQMTEKRKQAEEKLLESEARLLEAQRVAHIGNWSWDLQTNKLFWSKENYKIFCLSPEVLPSYENFERTVHPEDLDFVNKSVEDALERKKPYNSEFRIILPNNKVGFVQSIGNIEYDKEDKPLRFYGTVQDITKRKLAEEKIKASLKEKEILLQEIHHRVKNNMQIISSLLKLQASGGGDERVTDALLECRGRVQAMAFVHETLYGSDTLADIDFKTYISKVANQIFQTFKTSMDRVKLEVDAKDIKLGIEQATPLGLIINELVTNSLKYAFPENRSGEIVIHIRAVEQDSIEFVFSDNGIGIPEGLDWRNTDSLGLRLVIILADQLDGTVSLDRGKGTHFTVRFRHKENQ